MSSEEEAAAPAAGDFGWFFDAETPSVPAATGERPAPKYIDQLKKNAAKRQAKKLQYRENLAVKQSDAETRAYTTAGYVEAMALLRPGEPIAPSVPEAAPSSHSEEEAEMPPAQEVHPPHGGNIDSTPEERARKLIEARIRYEQRQLQKSSPGN